jgi:hypothetical protein
MVPHLEECLMQCSSEESMRMADLVHCFSIATSFPHFSLLFSQIQKGISYTRSDDTKSMKGAVLDWITPQDSPLNPTLSQNIKINCGFHHNITGALLCPTSMDWNDPEYVLLMSVF